METLPTPYLAGYLQFTVEAGAPARNLAKVRAGLAQLRPRTAGLVVLPELWATGFVYDRLPVLAAETPALLKALQAEAAHHGVLLAGSLPLAAGGTFYNTLFITGPEGTIGSYRKQRLFAPLEEDRHYTPGTSPQPIDAPCGRVGALVCYDLRFPELARSQAAQGARVFVLSAEWPLARLAQWRILVQARAIENQAFFIACNSCGVTRGTEFGGHSLVVGPDGTVLQEAGEQEEAAGTLLPFERLVELRGRFNTVAPLPYAFPDRDKIRSLAELTETVKTFKRLGRKVVFTNGCFDLLHVGHVTYLEAARRQGDCLIVGLNSDASIQAIKGPGRPINREQDRARTLAALGCVDYVVLFAEETPLTLIKTLLPDVLVKGADWPVEQIVGAKEVLAAGGRVANIPLVGEVSTTALIKRIQAGS